MYQKCMCIYVIPEYVSVGKVHCTYMYMYVWRAAERKRRQSTNELQDAPENVSLLVMILF